MRPWPSRRSSCWKSWRGKERRLGRGTGIPMTGRADGMAGSPSSPPVASRRPVSDPVHPAGREQFFHVFGEQFEIVLQRIAGAAFTAAPENGASGSHQFDFVPASLAFQRHISQRHLSFTSDVSLLRSKETVWGSGSRRHGGPPSQVLRTAAFEAPPADWYTYTFFTVS